MNDDELSPERAKKQFASVIKLLRDRASRMMETPQGRKILRMELGAMQGVPPNMVKLEGFEWEEA